MGRTGCCRPSDDFRALGKHNRGVVDETQDSMNRRNIVSTSGSMSIGMVALK